MDGSGLMLWALAVMAAACLPLYFYLRHEEHVRKVVKRATSERWLSAQIGGEGTELWRIREWLRGVGVGADRITEGRISQKDFGRDSMIAKARAYGISRLLIYQKKVFHAVETLPSLLPLPDDTYGSTWIWGDEPQWHDSLEVINLKTGNCVTFYISERRLALGTEVEGDIRLAIYDTSHKLANQYPETTIAA